MSWLSTVSGRFDWTCLCGAALTAPGFHRITCACCGRRWTLRGRLTIDYQETPRSKAYVGHYEAAASERGGGASLWETMPEESEEVAS